MTENELKDAIIDMVSIAEDAVMRNDFEVLDNAGVQLIDMVEEIQQYRAIGTIEECRKAVEKQKAKEPRLDGDGYAPDGTFVWDEWICPNCETRYEMDFDDYDYCPNCGQHIEKNWSVE